MASDVRHRLEQAIGRSSRPSSDYDLNPEIVLPEGRMLRPAAVLVGVVDRPDEPALILTKRSSALKHHPGQISFPGGKVEPEDQNDAAAALREANEEIALDPKMADILGTLPPHETVTGFRVTPVVALILPEFTAVPETGEVAEIFETPLAHVLDLRNYSVQHRRWRGQRRYYFAAPWGPYYIWGATARILRALADRMYDDTD